ncbi:uncharacterized protein LOC133896978 [Phragmites australis]|uniref:uncharacterized protein LOC133896978 n=1 Tax=Phragmites australis TaxID=29695 RepID=UPI002D7A046A|nr:uncharacterized protein LOC133896978 [Phragmites australis]
MSNAHRGLRRRLAGPFSSAPSQNLRPDEQGYLGFCLEVAQEHGFLHLISDNAKQRSPRRDAKAEPATADDDEDEPVETPPCDPYLTATREFAVQHGLFIAPDEIELHEVIGQGTAGDIHRATWRGLDVAVKPEFFCSNQIRF